MARSAEAVEHFVFDRAPDFREPPVIRPDRPDPSMDYPPTRPTWRMLLAAIAVVAAGVLVVNWAQVSAYVHISQIEAEFAQVTGL
jgi:hypothetical protein